MQLHWITVAVVLLSTVVCLNDRPLHNRPIHQYRGCRGSGHKNAIPVVITSTRDVKAQPQYGINGNNLMDLTPSQKDAKLPSAKYATLGVLNARSVMNKSDAIVDHILENELDILALTETWVPYGSDNDPMLNNLLH